LITLISTRDETLNKDSKLVNCIGEKDPEGGDYWVWKRPGLAFYTLSNGGGEGTPTGRGIYNWKGDVYSIFGDCLYKNGGIHGYVDTSNGKYVFQIVKGDPGYLVMGNGVVAYCTDGTTLTEITGNAYVKAGYFVVGESYTIVTLEDTDFTLIGATLNSPGEIFTATGVGSGAGTAALTAGSFIVGEIYTINFVGTTDFTLIGAASNTVGVVFTATGVGTGTGNVTRRQFPTSFVKGWAYLDGTLYVMDSQARIWGSKNLDDPLEWDPLNFITARVEPDGGIALAKQLSYVVALKEWTSEVFYDAGNPSGSPLAPVQGAKSPFGCASADSVQSIDDILLWITSNRTVSARVAMMVDLKVQVISTPPIDRLLDRADFSVVHSWNFKHGGHRFYGFTLVNQNLTLVYDLDQGLWYQWTDTDGNYWPIIAETFTSDDLHLVQHEDNGKLYLLEGDYEYPTDDGDVISVEIRTANANFGIDRRKILNVMRVNADQTPGSVLEVRVSDDDYQTWSQWRQIDLSRKRPILTKCGTFYRRAWWLKHRRPTAFRIKSIDLQMDIGSL
jgi:hypothetical protein